MKNQENNPNEGSENVKSNESKDALLKDQNEKENRGELEKINNGLEVDEINLPEEEEEEE